MHPGTPGRGRGGSIVAGREQLHCDPLFGYRSDRRARRRARSASSRAGLAGERMSASCTSRAPGLRSAASSEGNEAGDSGLARERGPDRNPPCASAEPVEATKGPCGRARRTRGPRAGAPAAPAPRAPHVDQEGAPLEARVDVERRIPGGAVDEPRLEEWTHRCRSWPPTMQRHCQGTPGGHRSSVAASPRRRARAPIVRWPTPVVGVHTGSGQLPEIRRRFPWHQGCTPSWDVSGDRRAD
jgi:hypothetical protein